MRKAILSAVLLAGVLSIGTPAAFATDCNAYTPMASSGVTWDDYNTETLTEQKTTWDCWSMSGLSPTSLYYSPWYSEPGFEVRAIGGWATRSYTVPSGGGGHWTVQMDVQMIDPDHDVYNQLTGSVGIYHPATNTTTWTDFYYHDGTMGDDFFSTPYVDIYPAAGDTITVYIHGAWNFDDNSHSRFSNVHVMHDYF